MRVCPKCGYIDPPQWKHSKFSYHIDTIRREEFELLNPKLAKTLLKGGDITQDKDYYYRLNKTEVMVLCKAKIEWIEGNPFGAEKYEKFKHGISTEDKLFKRVNPSQRRLLEDDPKK